jgi:hypothetical protein
MACTLELGVGVGVGLGDEVLLLPPQAVAKSQAAQGATTSIRLQNWPATDFFFPTSVSTSLTFARFIGLPRH